MIGAIFKFILNAIVSLIQVIVWPINQLIIAALPDLSSQITSVTSGITQLFAGLGWAGSILPLSLISILVFVISIWLIVRTVSISNHMLVKAWNILQKIKFW